MTDHVGALRDMAANLNLTFDREFSRAMNPPGRVGIMLNQFHALDERAAMKLVADACNANFAILGKAKRKTLKKVIASEPLRESFEIMVSDVAAVCAENFAKLR